MNPRELDKRAAFSERVITRDNAGQTKRNELSHRFNLWAGLLVLRGGEKVIADRLDGIVSAILTIWVSDSSKQIRLGWIVEVENSRYRVNAIEKKRDDERFFELTISTDIAK